MNDNTVFEFDSGNPGPNILIFGGIHGNEHCGVKAIEMFMENLNSGRFTLLNGKVTFAFGNIPALKQNVRFIDKDMNRIFVDNNFDKFEGSSEYERVSFLKTLFEGKDAFLDLHSAKSPCLDFLISEEESLILASELSSSFIVTGWKNFSEVAGDTENYALGKGLKALTYEAGQHDDMISIENSYSMILKFLSVHGMINYTFVKREAKVLNLKTLYLKTSESDSLIPIIENFTFVKKDELLIDGARQVRAPFDCYLVFPCDPKGIKIGETICFLAELI